MDSILLLVSERVTLADMAGALSERGVQVQPRVEDRGGEYLLCRIGDEPAWEVSLERRDSPVFSELEDPDLLHVDKMHPDSVFLVAFKRAAFGVIHRLVMEMSWRGSVRYLKGDGSGVSFSATELGPTLSSPEDFGSS